MSRRFVLAFLALTVVVVAVLVVPLGLSTADRERDRLNLDLERDARSIGAFAEDTLEGLAAEDLQAAADTYAAGTGARAVILDADGLVVADSDPVSRSRSFTNRPEVAEALEGRVATGSRRSDTLGADLLYVAVPVASGGEVHGVVRLTYPTTELDRRVRAAWLTLVGVGGVSLIAAVVLAIALARSVTRPMRELEAAAARMGAGDLSTRAPEEGPPEVRALAAAFNDTSHRLEELIGAQDAFVADASHQLRTPLTALRLRLENLAVSLGDRARDRTDGGSEDGPEVEAALDEVDRLSRLVDGLLALARADRAAATATTEDVELAAVLRERQTTWAPVAEDRDVSLVVDAVDGLVAQATPDRLSQVLDNLIDNALEVSPPGSTVHLVARDGAGGPEVHVRDEGPGLSAAQRERAFDRFWQGPEGAGSSGLGLAIVRKLVEADGGSVDLDAAPEGGLDARVRLRPVL